MSIVAITGANGFIGRNLTVRLQEKGHAVRPLPHDLPATGLQTLLADVDLVVHLAGVNRPKHEGDFHTGNVEMTERLVEAIRLSGNPLPVLQTSSIQADLDNPYGRSKRLAEDILKAYGNECGQTVHIWRLSNVFGKWCRPNYNSVVATFCHNIARDLPISISDPAILLRLVYVDDLIDNIIALVDNRDSDAVSLNAPVYEVTLGELAACINGLKESRSTLLPGAVGSGFMRALHATYLSYLEPSQFSYPLKLHSDLRGSFAEVLRTKDAGQFSFFTAFPGVTRGGHYHHTKSEKFIVVHGQALFRFRHIITSEYYEIEASAASPCVIETVPGWAHDVQNIGDDVMVVMLWANETFDPNKPDTISSKVSSI